MICISMESLLVTEIRIPRQETEPQTKTGGTTILYLPNFTLRLPDLETYREPEETDPNLPAQNGEENPRTLPQRQDLEHQIKANDKHKRHGTSRGTLEMEMGRPRDETPR